MPKGKDMERSISVTLNLALVAGCSGAGAEPPNNDVLGPGGAMAAAGKWQNPMGQGGAQTGGAAERGGPNYGGTTNPRTTAAQGGGTATGGNPFWWCHQRGWRIEHPINYALNPSFEADRISVTRPVG